MIDAVTSSYGLHQLIYELAHILNWSSSCIDLIFTSQANFVMESGVYSSLHPSCHLQVVFAKSNLSILYPPPYERTVWFYEKANPELIQRAINEFDWTRVPSNISIDKIVCYFTKTFACNDRDPHWMNNQIKNLINEQNLAYKSYCCFNREVFFFKKFKSLQKKINLSVENSKQTYYSKLARKLANIATSSKAYWSILKNFPNNKKIPCIPSLFHES